MIDGSLYASCSIGILKYEVTVIKNKYPNALQSLHVLDKGRRSASHSGRFIPVTRLVGSLVWFRVCLYLIVKRNKSYGCRATGCMETNGLAMHTDRVHGN
jgi:hypothetical protein